MGTVTPVLFYGFIATVAVTGGLVAVAVVSAGARDSQGPGRSARLRLLALLLAWVAITGVLADRGALGFGFPPTMPLVLIAGFAATLALGFSRWGAAAARALPLWALVGFQSFRIPVEILLHRAWGEGLIPVQMTWSGLNFDVVTGVSAALLGGGLLLARVPRWVVGAWNVMGLLLLANVVTVGILSMPTPFRVFQNDPSTAWIMDWPWVWLPTVLVTSAVLGHVLVARKIREAGRAGS